MMISVVIGTLNQCDALSRVLNGFKSQTLSPHLFELIVVDSGSTDGTHDLLRTFNPDFSFRSVIQENNGKSGARNRGVSEATGDYIFITDADMIPNPHLLSTHLAAHNATTIPTCFEGVTLNMSELHWPPVDTKLSPYIHRNFKDRSKLGWYYFLTGNLSIPKHLFEAYGGFDMDFQGYGWEDLELGYRLTQGGHPLVYLKDAINFHYHVVSEIEEIHRNVKKGESARIMLKKHPELKTFLGINPLSQLIFRLTSAEGKWLKQMDSWRQSRTPAKHQFAVWFLKEYYYLSGLIGSST
ncbi:glycosyltransferase [bacterium]|nr:glycosyltransferase [bacterium]